MESPYFPDNSTFVGAWEYPSRYKIIDSRTNDKEVEIDILYIWKDVLNYKGETRKVTFFFVLEKEDWKINDIYHHKSTYDSAFRLSDIPWDYWFK